jgi:hypothetical protein
VRSLVQKFEELTAQNQKMQGYIEGLGAAQHGGQAPVQAPAEITDNDINKALEAGENPAAAIRALVNRAVSHTADRIVNEHVRPLQEYGVHNFQIFAESQVKGQQHFKRFEHEIKAEIERLPAAFRGSPQAWEYAYNLIKGRHSDELANEAAEEAVRKAKEAMPATTPGRGQPDIEKFEDGRNVPTAAELGGAEATAALRYKKTDERQLATRMGYKSWGDAVKQLDLPDPYEDDYFVKTGRLEKPKAA